MATMRIRTWGDPILKTRAREIDEVTDEIRKLAQDMFETMQAEGDGVGLAANQVGVGLRMFVVEIGGKNSPTQRYTLINPKIVSASKETETQDEGCLSFPGIFGPVVRKRAVEVQGLDLKGKSVTLRGEGLLARVCQHELDHLDGVVFVERMTMVQRLLLNRPLAELARHTRAALAGRGTPKI
jgi:peptide deformylase